MRILRHHNHTFSRHGCKGPNLRRSAVVILELIVGLPILIIFLFAVVEFGLILALSKQVSFASRYAAKIASEESRGSLGDVNLPAGGNRLLASINAHLETSGINSGACQVILEHNVLGADNDVQVDGPGGCSTCTSPLSGLPVQPLSCVSEGLPAPESVRVTVCISIEDNIPDLLCGFGFSIEDCVIKETTTYRFEDCLALDSPTFPPSDPPSDGGGGDDGGGDDGGGDDGGNGNNGKGNGGNGKGKGKS